MYFHVHSSQVLQLLLRIVSSIITIIIILVFSFLRLVTYRRISTVSPTFLQPQAFVLHSFLDLQQSNSTMASGTAFRTVFLHSFILYRTA